MSSAVITPKRKNIWIGLYSLSLLTFLMGYAWGLTSHSYRSIFSLMLTYLFALAGFVSFFFFSGRSKSVMLQLLVVYLFGALFYDLSFFSEYTTKPYMLAAVLGLISINLPPAVILAYVCAQKSTYAFLFGFFKRRFEMFILLLLFVLFSIETLGTMTRLDANIYYTNLQEAKSWNLSFDTISLFKIGGHQALGYAVLGLIGIYLTPNSPVGLRLINLLLGCMSLAALYAIFEKILPLKKFQRCILFLATGLFAFHPLFLGIIYDITLDFPSLCFYIWVVYSLLYGKRIFLLFSSLFLVFSKETGVILLGGVVVGWGFGHVINVCRVHKKSFIKHFDYVTTGIMAVVPLISMLIAVLLSGLWRMDLLLGQNAVEESAVGKQLMSSFGVLPENTAMKLKELLLLNFSWVISALIVVCAIVYFVKKWSDWRCSAHGSPWSRRIQSTDFSQRRPTDQADRYCGHHLYQKMTSIDRQILIDFLPILVSFAMFVAFQFVYITYCNMRYILPYFLGFLGIFLFLLVLAFSEKHVIVILSIVMTLFFAECFYTLDPVSKRVCDTVDIGETEIYSTRTFVKDSDGTPRTKTTHPGLIECFQLTNSAIYNRQYMYFLSAFEEMIDEIDYDDETYIAIAPIYEEKGFNMTWTCLFGRWYSDKLFYDVSTHHLTDDESKRSLNLSVIKSNDDIPYENYDRVYLISFPYNKLFDNDSFIDSFDVVDSFTVSKRLWEIYVYQLK